MSAFLINAILLLILEAAIIRFDNHEPSASMGILSEKRMFENLLLNYTNEKNRTIILVSHRLSQLKDIEKDNSFEKGQITEEGMHQELLQNEETYKRMFEAYINQKKMYVTFEFYFVILQTKSIEYETYSCFNRRWD